MPHNIPEQQNPFTWRQKPEITQVQIRRLKYIFKISMRWMSHWSSSNYIHPRHHTGSSVPCPDENKFCFLIWRKQLQEGQLQHFPARSMYNISSWRTKNSPHLLLRIPSFLEGSPDKSTDFSCSKTERCVHPASAAGLHTSQILSLQGSFSMTATYFCMHTSK